MHANTIRRWRALCDRCGFKYWSDQLQKEWTGLMVCSRCWEARHPQDFVKGIPDRSEVPWTRPEAPDTSISPFIEDETLFTLLDEDGSTIWAN